MFPYVVAGAYTAGVMSSVIMLGSYILSVRLLTQRILKEHINLKYLFQEAVIAKKLNHYI